MQTYNSLNAAAVIAARELRERSRLFLVGAALAVIPFAAALVPGARGEQGAAIATVAGALAITYACGVALMQGVTVIGRDLSAKRLTFFFSKPVAPWTIWAGKAAAALLTTALAGAIVAIPAFLLSPSRWAEVWSVSGRAVLFAAVAACLSVFLGGHAVSTILRSRSMLIVLDVILAAATVGATYLILRPLFRYEEPWLWGGMLIGMGVMILAILAAVPAIQLARGRTDARRSHIALSRVLWPSVGVVLALGASTTLWLSSPTLESLDMLGGFTHSPSGRWALIHGQDSLRARFVQTFFLDERRRGLSETFLVNTATRESEPLARRQTSAVEFSRDGRAVVWIDQTPEPLPRRRGGQLAMRTLEQGAKTILLPVHLEWEDHTLVPNDDASRVVTIGFYRMRAFDTATGKLLAAANRARHSSIVAMHFASPSRVRLVEHHGGNAHLIEWNLDTGAMTETGTVPARYRLEAANVSASADGSLLYFSRDARIVDAVTGAVRATLPVPVTEPRGDPMLVMTQARRVAMLNDGKVVAVEGARMLIFDRNGRFVRDAALPQPLATASVAGQIGDDRVILSGRLDHRQFRSSTFVVNVRTGAVETTIAAIGPASNLDPRLIRYPAGAKFAVTDYEHGITYWSLK